MDRCISQCYKNKDLYGTQLPFKSRTLCAVWWQEMPTVLEHRSFESRTIFIHMLLASLKVNKILPTSNTLVMQMLLFMCLNNHYKQITFLKDLAERALLTILPQYDFTLHHNFTTVMLHLWLSATRKS